MNRIKVAALGSAAVAVLLTACNPAPKYAKPPVQTPAAFKEAPSDFKEGNGWKIAAPGDDRIRAKWWEMYNDPQLNALEEQVQINNQTVAQSEAAFRAARAYVISAREALAPLASVSPSYNASRFSSTAKGSRAVVQSGGTTTTPTTGTTTTGTTGTTSTTTTTGSTGSSGSGTAVAGNSTTGTIQNWSFPVDISYDLDFWHKIRNTLLVNTYQAQASAADVATALLSVQAELATDYFELREVDADRELLQQTVSNYRDTVKLTQTLFNAGIDSDADVAQAQTQLDSTIAQATDLNVARAQYEHAIATLIGKPASNFALGLASFDGVPPEIPVALPSTLLERRPDIAAAERRVAAANTEIGIVKAAYYPDISLTGSGGFQSSSITQWFSWPSRFWSIGPNVSEELFEAGIRRAQTQQAVALYDENVAVYRQTVLSAFQTVEDDLSSLRILQQELGEQRTALASAQHSLDLETTLFKSGVVSFLNVITAQNAVLTANSAVLQIRLRQMSSSISLVMALGGGWDSSQLPQTKQLTGKFTKPAQVQPPKEAQPPAAPNPPPLPVSPAPAS